MMGSLPFRSPAPRNMKLRVLGALIQQHLDPGGLDLMNTYLQTSHPGLNSHTLLHHGGSSRYEAVGGAGGGVDL